MTTSQDVTTLWHYGHVLIILGSIYKFVKTIRKLYTDFDTQRNEFLTWCLYIFSKNALFDLNKVVVLSI